MRRFMMLFVSGIVLTLPMPSLSQDAQQRQEWNRPFAPFKIIDNVYYVGPRGLSAFLITGPRGHVLIDGGLPESAAIIAANIATLGFALKDIKYLLINHSHFDHAGGLAELKMLTGAQVIATKGQVPDLVAGQSLGRSELGRFPAVNVDRTVSDGEVLTLGPIRLRALHTPGHTRGGVSWMTVAGAKRVLFATSLTVAGQKLVGDAAYPHAAADFRASFARLRGVKADIFLNFHPEFFDRDEKRAKHRAGGPNPFVDPSELKRQIDRAETAFMATLREQQTVKRK